MSIIHILKVYRHLRRARNSDVNIDTILPRRPKKNIYVARAISTPPPSTQLSTRREPINPTFDGPNLTTQKFHMPFSPPLSLDDTRYNSSTSSTATGPSESLVSSDLPTFANPVEGGTMSIDPDGLSTTENLSHPKEDWRDILGAMGSPPDNRVKNGSYRCEDDKFDSEYGKCVEHDDEDCNSGGTRLTASEPRIGSDLTYSFLTAPSTVTMAPKLQRLTPSLAPAIWRMILFQLWSFIWWI